MRLHRQVQDVLKNESMPGREISISIQGIIPLFKKKRGEGEGEGGVDRSTLIGLGGELVKRSFNTNLYNLSPQLY